MFIMIPTGALERQKDEKNVAMLHVSARNMLPAVNVFVHIHEKKNTHAYIPFPKEEKHSHQNGCYYNNGRYKSTYDWSNQICSIFRLGYGSTYKKMYKLELKM